LKLKPGYELTLENRITRFSAKNGRQIYVRFPNKDFSNLNIVQYWVKKKASKRLPKKRTILDLEHFPNVLHATSQSCNQINLIFLLNMLHNRSSKWYVCHQSLICKRPTYLYTFSLQTIFQAEGLQWCLGLDIGNLQ